MKMFAKLAALVLVVAVLVTAVCGCHTKNEIAYTIGEHKFTSAFYSCVLYSSATAARNDIYLFVQESGGDTKNIIFENYKFDENGKVSPTGTITYEQRVITETVNKLKQFAAVKDEMKKANVTLTEDVMNSIKLDAQSFWAIGCDYYTYQQYASSGYDLSQSYTPLYVYLEPNGVAYETYEKFKVCEQEYLYYFDHIYGEGGSKEVPKAELNEYLNTHYALTDTLTFSKKGDDGNDLAEDKLTELKATVDKYAERINAGEAFGAIYDEYQKSIGNTTSTTTQNTEKPNEYTPEAYKYIYGDEASGFNDTMFADIHKSELGKAVVYDDKDGGNYILYVKRDILEQEYWLNIYRTTITYNLKNDEFLAGIKEVANTYTAVEDTHATSPFKVDKIKFS